MGCLLLKQQVGACELSDFDSAETFPLFSRRGLKWIHSRTGDPLGLDTFDLQPETRHYFPPWPIQQSLRSKACPSITDTLPPRDLVEQYANAHFSSIMHAIVPLVDPVRFNEMVDLLYSTSAEMFYSPDCQACIHIFLVFAAKVEISQLCTTLAPIDEDSCVQATLALLPEILGGRWTITGLEAVLMLVRTSSPSNRLAVRCSLIMVRLATMPSVETYSSVRPFTQTRCVWFSRLAATSVLQKVSTRLKVHQNPQIRHYGVIRIFAICSGCVT
jgi:hypothetical protein